MTALYNYRALLGNVGIKELMELDGVRTPPQPKARCTWLAIILALFATSCASLPPAQQYTMDSQQRCLMQHVWDQTVVGTGVTMDTCSAITGWSQERKRLDAEDAIANLAKEAGK